MGTTATPPADVSAVHYAVTSPMAHGDVVQVDVKRWGATGPWTIEPPRIVNGVGRLQAEELEDALDIAKAVALEYAKHDSAVHAAREELLDAMVALRSRPATSVDREDDPA